VSRTLRIGTRRSALALAQAEAVAALLRPLWRSGPVELVHVVTTGDRLQEQNPAVAGGRGIFVKELEAALLTGGTDLCVHSAKDVPPELPDGLGLVATPGRADPRDALCGVTPLMALRAGATVATGSPRRSLQLLRARPDLRVIPLRGNVDTRLERLAAGHFAAAVLAVCGLERLGRASAIAEALSPEVMVPAAGQGALAIEARLDDPQVLRVLRQLDEPAAAFAVCSERAVLAGLGGGCAAPAGAYERRQPDGRYRLVAVVCGPISGGLTRAVLEQGVAAAALADRDALVETATQFGAAVVQRLLAEGAGGLLAESPAGEGVR